MWSLSNRVADKVRRSAARKWHTRGKRQDSRQPRLEALEARVVLSGGVFVQPLGPTTIGPSTVGDDFPRASFVDSSDRIVVARQLQARPAPTWTPPHSDTHPEASRTLVQRGRHRHGRRQQPGDMTRRGMRPKLRTGRS